MAKKPKNGRKKSEESSENLKLDLKPETSRAILSVVLFAFALISLLSLMGLAGAFGQLWRSGVSSLIGVGVFIMPILLAALGLAVLNLKKFPTKSSTYLGFLLFVLAFAGFAHLFLDSETAFDQARDGHGGGLIGFVIGYPLLSLFGFWASIILFIALIVVSLLLFFNQSFKTLFTRKEAEKAEPGVKIHGAGAEEDFKPSRMKILDFKKKAEPKVNGMMPGKPVKKDYGPPIETKKPRTDWEFPPVSLLDDELDRPASGDIKKNARVIQETLAHFDIPVEMGDVSVGPTVTQYTLRPDAGIKLNRIVALQNDLALSLAAHPIRIEAPIPGKSVVGVEIPNISVATVRIRELLESKEIGKTKGELLFPLGRDVAGAPVITAIEKMPHLLIAGATGSGKSVAINSMLISLLYRNAPSDLKLILVDPKRVELSNYNDIPHLLTPVITDAKKTVNSLRWIVGEMDRRYKVLQEVGVRNIAAYNGLNKESHLPKIVVVIDELADLMSVAARDVEASIVRLAQMARAVGIHLVVATQRPSVDVITGLIKANITTRIAFSVASLTDSRTILDASGAEKLLGNGDMLYISSDLGKPRRVQGAFVSDKEVEKVTDFLKKKKAPEYLEEVTEKHVGGGMAGSGEDVDDDLYEEAKQVVIQSKKASASLLQRRLRVGYARAARLIDLLEEQGVVGPGEGAKPREILVGSDEDNEMDGSYEDSPQEMAGQDASEERKPDLLDIAEEQEQRERRDF